MKTVNFTEGKMRIALVSLLLFCASVLGQTAGDGHVNFTFDQVEVRSFVKLVGEMTGRRFIVDQGVEGKITVVSPKIRVDEVFPIFTSILESAGCSVVEEQKGVYRVVAISSRPSAPVVGADEKIPLQGIVTKVFRLKYVSAEELRKVLEPKVRGGDKGAIGAIETTNHLIVTDTAENIRRIEKIVDEVDQPGSGRVTEVIALKFANSEDMAEELSLAMFGTYAPGGGRMQSRAIRGPAVQPGQGDKPATVVSSPHSNSLILVGTASQIMELKRIIELMDVDSPSGGGRLSAIFLKYISAEDAAKSLNALLEQKVGKGQPANPQRIALQAHPANNALLVDAVPRDFEWVQALIQDLDKPVEQVLIEVLIAEVTVSDDLDIGVDIVAVELPSKVGSTTIQGSLSAKEGAIDLMTAIQTGLFPGGLSVGIAHGLREDADGNVVPSFPGLINIDAARTAGKFDILSNIPLLAQNNREASVSIVNNIPILKSTISGGTGTARDIIQNIERIDVGIKLKLTPHINPNGEVVMNLNPSIEAVIAPGPLGDKLAPTIARREIQTTVTVPDGKTIVLSGLIREDQTETVRRIPFLGSIPLIGWLFRHTIKGSEKTNLLVFVTPHIVTDIHEAERITDEWRRKTSLGDRSVSATGKPEGVGKEESK